MRPTPHALTVLVVEAHPQGNRFAPAGVMVDPMHGVTRRHLVIGAAAGVCAVAADALGIEPRWLDLSRHDVPVPGLPAVLEGYRIAQITDAHLTSLGALEEQVADVVREVAPQLVVLTGDLIDAAAKLPVLRDFCRALGAWGRTVVATLGNWEHWGDVPRDDIHAAYAAVGVRLLVNESYRVHSELVVGATDDSTGGIPEIDPIVAALPARSHRVLLTHSPALMDRLPAGLPQFDLALSGHTHGGQVRAGSVAPFLPPGSGRFVAGWYDTGVGRLYVSRGTGTSIVPARFMCRPEVPVFRLVRG